MHTGCLYLPEFPAWALARKTPDKLPLIVVASGRVVSFSPGLRRSGISAGMRAGRAREIARGAHIALQDRAYEEAAWEEVLSLLYEHTPFIEPYRPGTAFFRALDVASTGELTDELDVQIGLAIDRQTARLAARQAAPGRMLAVPPEHRRRFLDRYPLSHLTGIGFEEEFLRRMQLFGYKTLGEARALSLKHLRDQFGAAGEALHRLLHPGEDSRVATYQPPPAITGRYDVEHPASGEENLLAALEHVAGRLTEELAPRQCQRVTLAVAVEGYEGVLSCRKILPAPTGRLRTLFRALQRLLVQLLRPDARVHALHVELGALSRPEPRQTTLFEERPEVERAVEAVERRYPGAIRRPVITEHALFPEDAISLEAFPTR